MSRVPLPIKTENEILYQKQRSNVSAQEARLEYNVKYDITISGTATPKSNSLNVVRSSFFRPVKGTFLKNIFINFENAPSKNSAVYLYINEELAYMFYVPSNTKFARTKIPGKTYGYGTTLSGEGANVVRQGFGGIYLHTYQVMSLEIVNVDPTEIGNVSIVISGECNEKYNKDLFLFFAEEEKEPIGIVYDSIIQENGQIVLAGAFETCRQTKRKHLARLNSDGSLDTTFDVGVGPNAPIVKIKQDALNSIYAIGSRVSGGFFGDSGGFNTWNNIPYPNFAKVLVSGDLDDLWELDPADVGGAVFDFELSGEKPVGIGGPVYGGLQPFFKLNIDGSPAPLTYPASVFTVYAQRMVQSAGGKFLMTYLGSPYSRLYSFDSEINHTFLDGQLWGFNYLNIPTMAKVGLKQEEFYDKTFIPMDYFSVDGAFFGSFTFAGGILKVTEDAFGFFMEVYNEFFFSSCHAVKVLSDGNIIAGGGMMRLTTDFENKESVPLANVIKFNENGEVDEEFVNNFKDVFIIETGPVVYTLQEQEDGKILVGGKFEVFNPRGPAIRKNFIRLNADGSLDESFPVI